MAYEIEDIRTSQEIFYYLLEHHEMSEEAQERLFRGYAECDIERYGDVVYLIPREDNTFLGFSKAQLKQLLCKSGGTDKDYYLSQFVILTLLVEFYDGQGATSKTRDYMRVGELQNCVSSRLREGAERTEEDGEEGASGGGGHSGEERLGLAFSNMEGFLYNILNFLQKQGLIEYVEEDEMIKTTKKLDQFMDWNLLNQNHFQRVRRVMEGGHSMEGESAGS